MTEPARVWHIADPLCPADAVYVGRGTPYGNPFIIGFHGNRDEVIELYRTLVTENVDMLDFIQKNLAGKHIMCHCWPDRCHGDVLLYLANAPF